MRKLTCMIVTVALSIAMTSVGFSKEHTANDIVDTAVSAGSFKTLVTAVKAAGLVAALKSDGPLTVFAPTDEAFAKLPEGTIPALLRDKQKLQEVLKYHVVAGRVTAADVVKLSSADTLLGQPVRISTCSGVKINNSNVVTADVFASNGVIHVIDTVLLPPPNPSATPAPAPKADIVDTAVSAGSFKTLVTAVQAAGLVDALKSDGPLTVFAPTDEAFAKLPAGTIPALLRDKEKLQAVLKYHVVSGKVTAADVAKLASAKTLQGQAVRINASDNGVSINDANVVKADILTSNGVIHVIDSVLLPPDRKLQTKAARQMIRHAVAKGAPMYNQGHHSACASVYHLTAMNLMKQYGDEMPESVRTSLQRAMNKAEHSPCSSSRAWALRHGLDAVYMAMSEIE